jgi:hypothetical protein
MIGKALATFSMPAARIGAGTFHGCVMWTIHFENILWV